MRCFSSLLILLFYLVFFPGVVEATHNRAGEITFVQLSDLSIRATLTTYTKTESIAADRDTITIYWGDGSFTNIKRVNGFGEELPNNVKKNIYIAEHTYPGRGIYNISMIDPNRIADILNVDPPNSINIPFFLQSTVNLINSTFQGINHSPVLLKAPIDIACLGQIFVHNPSAFDEDGDSLSFKLLTPLMDYNTPVPNYLLPNLINPGLQNNLTFNSQTGTLYWNAPQRAGEYNIAFEIIEYRKGIRIGSVIRDMQIVVIASCATNSPPTVIGIDDTCIIAGTELNLNYIINDPNKGFRGGKVKIEVGGAAFIVNNPATANFPSGYNDPSINLNLNWKTECSHVRKDYYTFYILATDDYYENSGLSTIYSVRVKVTAPPPEDLISLDENSRVRLLWKFPYPCKDFESDFKGFSVWRSETPIALLNDTCVTGLENSGYQQIAFLVNLVQAGRYQFIDTAIERGTNYCYRVQAEFSKTSSSGFPYNFSPSLFSNETCIYLPDDRPILLNVDVQETSEAIGKIFLRWSKPNFEQYDTFKHIGPYIMQIYRSVGNQFYTLIHDQNFLNFGSWSDTSFTDDNLNTKDFYNSYFITIRSSDNYLVVSDTGQSLFILPSIDGNRILLNWKVNAPWENYNYDILRKTQNEINFKILDSITSPPYHDTDVDFGKTYCYVVRSYGKYSSPFIPAPLINNSQESCIELVDTTAPCCPVLNVAGPCGENRINDFNYLNWNNPNIICSAKDVKGYRIYIKSNSDTFTLLKEIDNASIIEYKHYITDNNPVCYLIKSFDTSGIECIFPDTICVIYCPEYELPNTFTPNGDGRNDLFKPIINKFIEKIDIQIINRWGQLVYKTTDPEINWTGNDLNENKLSDGVYFYTCKIYPFPNLKNTQNTFISGFIELLSGK